MKLLEFQKKVNAIKKDGKNPHFKSSYATLTQIISEVKPVLSECGVLLIQPIKDNKVGTVLSDDKEILAESWIDLPTGLNPQQLGSAITYFRRYTLASLLALEIEDDDANLASGKRETPKAKATESTVKAMLDAIKKGQRSEVENRMGHYEFTDIQLQTLKMALNGL